MKKGLIILFISFASLLYAEQNSFDAGSIYINVDENENNDIDFNKDILDDFFAGGNIINFNGTADDLYLMGKKINLTGRSSGGVVAFGEKIKIDGNVDKNLHSAGSDIVINGHVKETSFLGADEILINESAVLDGTLFSGSSSLHIMGRLNSGLIAGAGEIIIDGPIVGNVNVRTGKLIITERGSIDGNLIYGSGSKISTKESKNVSGSITYEVKESIEKDKFSKFFVVVFILFYVALIVTGLLLLLLPSVRSLFIKNSETKSYFKTMLWGLIPVFIFPVLILITIPLFPISIILGLSVFPLLWVCTILGLIFSGQQLFKLIGWENRSIFIQYLLTVILYIVIVQIPFLKVLVMLGVLAIGAGLILSRLFNTKFK